MNGTWNLEFVGGPYDGRKDIVTPVEQFSFLVMVFVRTQCTVLAEYLPLPYAPRILAHVYRRGTITRSYFRKGMREGTVIEEECWVYHGIEAQ